MNKCAVFDLDGTLLNTITTIAYYGNKTLKKFGFPEIDIERYKVLVGNGARILIERMLNEFGGVDSEAFEEIFNYYVTEYDKDVQLYTEIYDGIEEMLRELKAMGYKLVVLSNKPDTAVQAVIKRYFGDVFDEVSGAFEHLPKKPDPMLLNQIMEKLDCDKENSIYVGDTDCDMQTGNAGGLFTIGVLWGFRTRKELEENNASLIVSHPSEITDYVKREF